MSHPPPLLEIKDLRRLSIGPLSLSVEVGDCLCISGQSGSGKSQLLRSIADMDPHEGRVCLDGQPAKEIPPHVWRTRVGMLPPESAWWLPHPREHFRNGTPVPLDEIGLQEAILDQPVARLSSGEKQRLALMRLLSNRPEVLLLDEPTANLDPENTLRVEAVIERYRSAHNAAIIWVSHDVAQVERVANRYYELADGTLHAHDLPEKQWLN